MASYNTHTTPAPEFVLTSLGQVAKAKNHGRLAVGGETIIVLSSIQLLFAFICGRLFCKEIHVIGRSAAVTAIYLPRDNGLGEAPAMLLDERHIRGGVCQHPWPEH